MNFSKSLQIFLIFLIIFAWVLSGWPQIWPLGELGVNKIRIPPEVQEAKAATATYDFSLCGTDCDTSTDWWASGDDVDVFPFAGVVANRNTHLEATDAQYSNLATSNNLRYTTADPGNGDEILLWNEMKINENPAYITQIDLTFEGYLALTADFSIWVKKTGQAYELDTSWVQVGTVQSITGGVETSFTRSITANFSDYIGADGILTWAVYESVSSEAMNIDYVSAVVTYVLPTFEQSAYRLFNNLDSTDVGTALAAQDTAATLGAAGAAFRLRMLLHIGTNQLAVSGQTFKLQFAQRGADNLCDTAFSGETYADVTAATVIAYKDNTTPADGASLTANANDPTHGTDTIVNQTYEELNNFTNSVAAIPAGQDGKWDFSLKDNGATANTAYCLRAVKSDGTVLDTYSVIPEITTASAAIISVSVSDGAISYGTIPASSTKSTCDLSDTQIVTNNGNVAENFNIMGSTSTNWTLGATPGTDIYVHKFCTSTCATPPTNYTALTTSYQTMATNIAANATTSLDLYINTPNPSTVFTQQSVDVTIQAVQY